MRDLGQGMWVRELVIQKQRGELYGLTLSFPSILLALTEWQRRRAKPWPWKSLQKQWKTQRRGSPFPLQQGDNSGTGQLLPTLPSKEHQETP